MTDFFISYTGVDSGWAEWIAYALEEKGFKTVVQAWDFRPGSNFVIEMQNAMTAAERTIMVLSPEYLKSVFTAPEWAGAFAQDPEGLKRKLVPVMVKACQPQGLLAPIVHISIVGLDATAARDKLLAGLNATRAKPSSPPAFPGEAAAHPQKAFPGPAGGQQPASAVTPAYIPTVRRQPTDIDKRRFIKQSFATIRALFETGLQALPQNHGLEHDFSATNETDFRAEIFLEGRSRCFCRIWLGGMHSENNICFSEVRSMSGDACNEIIALSDRRDDLALSALMAMSHTQFERTLDMKRLTPDEAANYLWHRFVAPLER
jgi:hypothetical protein